MWVIAAVVLPGVSTNAHAETRVALLVGNTKYRLKEDRLKNPCKDVNQLAKVLRAKPLNFTVQVECDVDRLGFHHHLKQFKKRLVRDSIGLFYYSGHAVEADHKNYMLPVDHQAQSEDDLHVMAYPLQSVVNTMDASASQLNIVLLDACRDNPLPKSVLSKSGDRSKGLQRMKAKQRTLIGFAAAPGEKALDGKKHSPYAQALFKVLPMRGLSLLEMMNHVAHETAMVTDGFQEPWSNYSRLPLGLCLSGCRVNEPDSSVPTSRPVVQTEQTKTYDFPVPKMKSIKGGTFQMGCSPQDNECEGDEKPRHTVTLDAFQMGQYEVTFEQYDYYCNQSNSCKKPDDEGWGRDQRPVINVSWNDAQAYIQWLKQKTGERFRLCTEAEWEYAARAGTETKYSWGNKPSGEYANGSDYDNYWPKDGHDKTAPVGSYKPNPWGLHDMHGNVWEWVQDRYDKEYYGNSPKHNPAGPSDSSLKYRVLRGGSWNDFARNLRSGYRYSRTPDYRDRSRGFRLCLG